jgi:transcriptional regulator with XRE-family HTH domain
MLSAGDKKALKKFGQHLAALRKTKNLSLREMSYACDIDNSKISKIERGEINVTLITIFELSKALDVPPGELLNYPQD